MSRTLTPDDVYALHTLCEEADESWARYLDVLHAVQAVEGEVDYLTHPIVSPVREASLKLQGELIRLLDQWTNSEENQ
jgi:hypothetical protein